MRNCKLLLIAALAAVLPASAQSSPPPHPVRKTARPHAAQAASDRQYQSRKKFVLDVIGAAVSLPEADPQDRLRVLVSATQLARSLSPPMADKLAEEGVGIEMQLVGGGIKPAASVIASGLAGCRMITNFVDSLTPESLPLAADSVARAASMCGRQALPSIQRKLDDATRTGGVPPRALLAAIEASGLKSSWSQQHFQTLFSSLPDPQRSAADAPLLAAIYARVSPFADKDVAREAGLGFLEWLGKMDPGAEQTQAATLVTAAMKKALGEKRYDAVLRSNVMAAQAAQLAGRPFEIAPPLQEAGVSVLKAISSRQEQNDSLQELAPAQRARQAAAYGFSAGKSGDRASADRYFDVAFSAAGDVWEHRFPGEDAVAVLEEISSAAAHVDAVAALARAQALPQPAAQAISMLAVAQVVLTGQNSPGPMPVANTAAR